VHEMQWGGEKTAAKGKGGGDVSWVDEGVGCNHDRIASMWVFNKTTKRRLRGLQREQSDEGGARR